MTDFTPAKLIAAAPDLYAALRMARHMEHVQSRGYEVEFIDAALARAEGVADGYTQPVGTG